MTQQAQIKKSAHSLPLVAEELTVDWLNEVLRPVMGDAQIDDFEATIIGVGEGFLGQLARLKLFLDCEYSNAPQTIIAKFASTKPETREFARQQNYYAREIGFYRDIGQEVGIPVPQCYFCAHIGASNHFVILLQDLAPAVASDQVEGTGVEDSKQVIETFATLHAKWWNSERLKSYDWAQPMFNAMPIAKGLEMLKRSIAKAEETGCFDQYPEMKRLMYLLPPICKMEPPPPFPFTLSHGDCRSDNIFYPTEAGGEFGVIDWQLAGMGQPMTDIARWLVQSISIDQRRETELDLLQLYHQKLLEEGVTGYSYKTMMQEYKLNLVVMLFMFSMGLDDIDQTPQRAQALFHQMYSRLDAALVDWQVVKILKVLPYLLPFLKLSVWLKMKFKR